MNFHGKQLLRTASYLQCQLFRGGCLILHLCLLEMLIVPVPALNFSYAMTCVLPFLVQQGQTDRIAGLAISALQGRYRTWGLLPVIRFSL